MYLTKKKMLKSLFPARVRDEGYKTALRYDSVKEMLKMDSMVAWAVPRHFLG
jgi:hypothetical protein